ncbi:MAG: hypothetical protein IMF12_05330, partial [Proteobacteria bacterium]|nr:hypothetical protein [Pseudomonadota bacterium]
MILLLISYLNILQPLEHSLYNLGIQKYTTNDKVAIITIDDLEQTWSDLAQLIDLLAPHAQAIGITFPLNKFSQSFERSYIEQLTTMYQKLLDNSNIQQLDSLLKKVKKNKSRYKKDKLLINQLYGTYKTLPSDLLKFKQELQTASTNLNFEQQLIDSFKRANNVILGIPIVNKRTFTNYIS